MILSALLSVLFDQRRLKYGSLHSWNRSKKKRAKVQLLKWINVSYSEIKSCFFFLLFINFFWLRLCCIFVALCCKWKTGCDDALACGVWELLTSWHNHIFPFWILTAFSCLYCFTLSIHLSQMASLIILLSLSPIVPSAGEWKHVFIFSNII